MLDKAKKVIIKITNDLWKSEGQEDIKTPKQISVKFTLMFGNLTIGFLTLNNGVWSFMYSNDFKNQTNIKPLTDFPTVGKTYSNGELYPFFTQRIPSLSQPKIKAIVRKENIAINEVALLKRFGKISITNPFRLVPAF